MTEVQKQRLLTVKQQILAEPEMYDQAHFANFYDPCGTACCIAGWLVWNDSPAKFASRRNNVMFSFTEKAAALIGLEISEHGEERHNLFGFDWPNGWGEIVENGRTPLLRARAAAKMIDYVIEQESKR